MAMNTGSSGGYASEINITPLVDVVLVLLIIFMVIAPVMLHGYDVDVPGEVTLEPTDEHVEQIVMSIDLDACPILAPPVEAGPPTGCSVRINDDEVALPDLSSHLAETFADRAPAERTLFLAAHDRLNYEGVVRILDLAKSGVEGLRIGIVTENRQ